MRAAAVLSPSRNGDAQITSTRHADDRSRIRGVRPLSARDQISGNRTTGQDQPVRERSDDSSLHPNATPR
jgi:hypothetical protein